MKSRGLQSSIVLVEPGAADTEIAVAHELGTVPRGAFVLRATSSGLLYASTVVSGGLGLSTNFIAGWEFEDNTNLGKDSGSNALDLTNSANPVTQVAGKVGSAGNFVTASSQFLTRASSALLQTGDIDFSFAAWVRLTDKALNYMLVTKEGVGAANADYDMYYDVALDRFHARVWVAGVAANAVANTLGSPTAGVWYFIVFWHNATADTLNIQVNNGGVDSAATGGALQAPAAGAFQIGARDNAVSRLFANADIDQVMFWKRVLTAAERTSLYNSGAGVTVSTATSSPVTTPKPWTSTTAYLKSSVGGGQFFVMFFV